MRDMKKVSDEPTKFNFLIDFQNGGGGSCHTNKPRQSLTQKCGPLGRFEAKCVFSLPPSPMMESKSELNREVS
jgi:hypothetical protein